MSSFPPPPSPPPPPPSQPPGPAPWSTPIGALTDPPPPVSPKKSGLPAWVWIVAVVAVLGGGAFALFSLGGDDDDASSASTIHLGGDNTVTIPGSDDPGTVSTVAGGGGAPVGVTGTREAPVPAGQIADIGGDWRLQVIDVIPDASAQMAAEDEFFPEFEVYRGERLPPGKKSLNFTVTLGADDRTLTDDDESKFLGKVREQAVSIGGELRG